MAAAAGDAGLAGSPGRFMIIGLEAEKPEEIPQAIELVEEIRPFGVILFARNVPDLSATLAWTENLRSRLPDLVLSVDHEGGRVHRLPEPFTRFPPALVMARHGDPGLVREAARAQARELRAAGFDLSYAPVLDVHTNPDNPIIGDRAFGETPEEVVHNALPYLQGLAEAGILGCGKHFPGHGDTALDSHLALPTVAYDAERLLDVEMRPFARAIDQGLPMIMMAHVVYPALDAQQPASLSHAIITGIHRQRLGFRGVVVSDDLEMKAVCGGYEEESRRVGAAAVAALGAGSDLVMVCRCARNVRAAAEAIEEAIRGGEFSPAALENSDRRRRKLLRRIGRLRRIGFDPSVIGALEHRKLASSLAG